MASGPSSVSAAATAVRTLTPSVTSRATGTARPSMASISRASSASRSTRRAASATLAPALASVSAKWRPRPLDAPVTRAALPVRSKGLVGIGRSTAAAKQVEAACARNGEGRQGVLPVGDGQGGRRDNGVEDTNGKDLVHDEAEEADPGPLRAPHGDRRGGVNDNPDEEDNDVAWTVGVQYGDEAVVVVADRLKSCM